MHTVTARWILEAHADAPVTLRYQDEDMAEALATFPSLATALQGLSCDGAIRSVLEVTLQVADGPLILDSCDIDLMMEALRARLGAGAPIGHDFSDLMRLADQIATLAHRRSPARPRSLRIDKLGRA